MACCGWRKSFGILKIQQQKILMAFYISHDLPCSSKEKKTFLFLHSFLIITYQHRLSHSTEIQPQPVTANFFHFFSAAAFSFNLFFSFSQNKFFFLCAATHFLIRLSFLEAMVVRKIIHNR